MNFFKNYYLGNRKRYIEKRNLKKIGVIFLLGCMIISNFIFIQNQNNQFDFSNKNVIIDTDSHKEINPIFPRISADPSEFHDPLSINFTSGLTDYDIETYVRGRDSGGTTVDNGVYSLDNLLLYNSLLDYNNNQSETLEAYIKLKSTPLWYENDTSKFEYGFVGTIDGTTGVIIDDNRYLIDNLMPIFLLLEDGIDNLNDIEYDGYSANDMFEEAFFLVNSSVFYDDTDKGFINSNSTTTANIYQMKSNLYAILAYYTIYRQRDYISTSIADSAYDLASVTMENLISKMWDNTNLGFYKSANESWTFKGAELDQNYKFLDVNALGILALLDYWIDNEEMREDSLYFINATLLYNIMENALWNPSSGAYQYAEQKDWSGAGVAYQKIDLEANALMMRACLKFFEVTGNITYYNRALELYHTFENDMFDSSNNAYKSSLNPVNSHLNLTSNLRLVESYLKAFDIYNNTVLDAAFNITDKVNYIFNQDVINLTCDYAFEKKISYSHHPTTSGTNTTRYNNITGGVITYIFRYPNETIIDDVIRKDIISNTTTYTYPITDALPVGNGYTIKIKANSTYFGVAYASKTFNVESGLSYDEEDNIGLDEIDEVNEFYQGQTRDINITISSQYNYNLTLNVTLKGFGIENYTRFNLEFVNNSADILVELNISALSSAVNGSRTLLITFKDGSILYLEILIDIFITHALTYSNLIYNKDVVPGNSVQVSLELFNYLPNNHQLLNLTFTGEFVAGQNLFSYNLSESEVRTIITRVSVSSIIDVGSFEITMKILKGSTIIKSEILTVNIISKFEIIRMNYPEKVVQGVPAKLILIIKNNQETSEEFTLIINDDKVDTALEELVSGENRIEVEVLPTINPYEIGYKKFHIQLEDKDDEVIVEDYFESEIQVSTINLLLFYILPIIIPIGIILYYKNKEIKLKLLRR